MEEISNQLWEIFKIHQKFLYDDLKNSDPNKSEFSSDYNPYNITSLEELHSIIQFHYNRSLHLNSQQQLSVDQDCQPFGNVFEFIYSYYLPLIIFIGLIGNMLSCVVFLNTHLKMRSSSYYLAALACADCGFLMSLFFVWLNGTLEIPVFNIDGYCQCIVYVSSVCSFLSVWLIAAFTVERFIAVQYPFHRPQMCTVARAKAIVLYLVCISLTINTYVFMTSGIIKLEDGSEVCDMLEGQRDAMRVINIIDSVLTLIAPLILIVVMNSMIVYNLVKFSKQFKRPGEEPTALNSRRLGFDSLGFSAKSITNNTSRKTSSRSFPTVKSSNSLQRLSQMKLYGKSDVCSELKPADYSEREGKCTKIDSDKKFISTRSQQSITKMLLLISSSFVLLNLPSYGMRLYVFFLFTIWGEFPPVVLWCFQQMFMILYYTNFSINFLLYSMCGITFRRCLWQLVRKKMKKLSRYQCQR